MPIRVLVADDHTMVREGLRALLDGDTEIDVVSEVSDGLEALEMVRKHKPDIAILDIAMPKLNGLLATKRIRSEVPETKVLVLSMYGEEEYITEALKSGASGFILKDAAASDLISALKAVSRGERYLSPTISWKLVKKYVVDGKPTEVRERKRLSSREKEILQLIAEGYTNSEIAHTLKLSVKTVQTHRSHIMAKLDIHTIAGLTRHAIKIGLVDRSGPGTETG
jgi:DNA-binding NarL/FixJ family response regulator